MKKFIIICLIFICYNVYAVSGNRESSYFMICDKDGTGIVVRDVFVEKQKAFFLNYSSSYNYSFLYYNYDRNYDDMHSRYLNYMDVFKEFEIEDEKPYLLRLIWDEMLGEGEKTFCHDSDDPENKYPKLKEKILKIEAGPDFIQKSIVLQENEVKILDDELLKYYDITSDSSDLLLEHIDNTLKISGTEGNYEILLSKKIGFDEPAKIYTYGNDILIKYGYGVSKKHILNIVIEKEEVVKEDNEENLVVKKENEENLSAKEDNEENLSAKEDNEENLTVKEDEIIVDFSQDNNDKISFVPESTSCYFIFKKFLLKIMKLIFE